MAFFLWALTAGIVFFIVLYAVIRAGVRDGIIASRGRGTDKDSCPVRAGTRDSGDSPRPCCGREKE